MQLILNTDTDIGVQKKMSTIEQESLNEKFINKSIIENVCNDIADITNRNDQCLKIQEVDVCVKNTNANDNKKIQHIENNYEPVLNEKNNDNCKENTDICDEELTENKQICEIENDEKCQITDRNSLLDNRVDVLDEENREKEANDEDSNKIEENGEKNNKHSDIENSTGDQGEENCEMNLHNEGQNISELENKFEEQEGDGIVEEKIVKQGIALTEIEGKNVQGEGNSEIEGEINKQGKENSEIEGKTDVQDKENSEIEGKIDVQDKENSEIEGKIDLQDKENSEIESKLNEYSKENIEPDNKLGELDKDNNEIEDKPDECIKGNIEPNDKHDELGQKHSGIQNKLEEPEKMEICVDDNINEEDHQKSEGIDKSAEQQEDNIKTESHITEGQRDNEICNDQLVVHCKTDTDNMEVVDVISEISNDLVNKTEDSKEIQQTDEKPVDESEKMEECIDNEFNDTIATEVESPEIIDIPDEKDEESESVTDQDVRVIEKETNDNANLIEKVVTTSTISKDTDDHELKLKVSKEVEVKVSNDSVPETSVLTPKETLKEKENKPANEKNVEGKKKLTHISRLSNTLDILSDEDEEPPKEVSQNNSPNPADKQCINVEDDDDIMLIDEELNSKNSINKVDSLPEPITDNKDSITDEKVKKESIDLSSNEKDTFETEVTTSSVQEIKTNEPDQEVTVPEEILVQRKPLLPVNFLKTCKKNLADMSRDELEEFCILKIVESVVDRSNLSEIKSQLKSMAQNIEEYRKKASVLTKQNRDLQVVLKSVQEEQKKKSNMPITPLKITRSVGMQVLMTDKSGGRRKPAQGPNTTQVNTAANSAPNRQGKGQIIQNSRIQKTPANTNNNMLPIPVPRLVPALNNCNLNNTKIQPLNTNTPAKPQITSPAATNAVIPSVPNGLSAISPAPKPEKRPHSRIQQNNSVTVDLTDDEPPAKVTQRNITPPVRLVSPQSLLAPHRQPFGTNVNSPRKVYIPISGAQTQGVSVRPGQTIMLKTISPQGPRQRCPPPVAKSSVTPNTVRMQRMPSRHPAPLPDSMKQYQPPNWKALPPAPELKLSKVENGIVISWKIEGYQEDNYEEIASYQLYAYQETSSPPSTTLWKKIGDVKALPLPMACTLTQFMAGYKYYFAVRAVDVRSRLGPFSLPGSILLLNKM